MPYPLLPMTPEKSDLLDKACREWNQLMLGGQKLKPTLARSPQRKDILFNKLVRLVIIRRKILHWKMARHAGATGLSKNYPYTPNTGFFIPYYLVTRGETVFRMATHNLIVLRLFPWQELAFWWNSDNGWGKSWKIHRVKGEWHIDFRI